MTGNLTEPFTIFKSGNPPVHDFDVVDDVTTGIDGFCGDNSKIAICKILTGFSTISELQDQEIGGLYVVQKQRTAVFYAS